MTPSVEENRKVFVGKIPKGISDDFMERLLRCCGPLKLWRRSTDATGENRAFGFAEYEQIESVFASQKILNGLPLDESRISVKADQKTNQFLKDWKDLKKMEWIAKQEKLGITVDMEDLDLQEESGQIQPYERELIPLYDQIIDQVNSTLDRRDIIESVANQARPDGLTKQQ